MTQTEILEELRKLSPEERLQVVEAAIHLVREDLQHSSSVAERKRQLSAAAEALLPDYTEDSELTSFTALDNEDFHG